jgi:tripartite-type tricarboxylate transporter receptor subunit TctC
MTSRRTLLAALAFTGFASIGGAAAQPSSSRLVTVVVPGPPGSTPDLLARVLAERLRQILGHSHLLNSKLSFDPHAFAPVGIIARYPLVLIGRKDLPVGDIAEMIRYARVNPGKLSYASSGIGSMHQLVYEAIKKQANIDLTHVPYRGGPPAMNDLLAGHVDVSLTSLNQAAPLIKEGKLKLLAIVGGARLTEFPDAPALTEVLPGQEADAWSGMVAPPRTPEATTKRLSDAIAQVLQMPDVRARLAELLLEPVGNTPDEMRAIMRKDAERWAPVVTAAKITIN